MYPIGDITTMLKKLTVPQKKKKRISFSVREELTHIYFYGCCFLLGKNTVRKDYARF